MRYILPFLFLFITPPALADGYPPELQETESYEFRYENQDGNFSFNLDLNLHLDSDERRDHDPDYTPGSSIELTPQDRRSALHAIAIALAEQSNAQWSNPFSGMSGHIGINYRINSRCVTFTNLILQHDRVVWQETLQACRGGGNSNTWIINNRWHISSVERAYHGACRTRFMDARLERGREYSERIVCWDRYNLIWNVED